MPINLNIKTLPPYLKIVIAVVPSLILIILFIILIYSPKNKEIKSLKSSIVKLDNEIATGEVKIRKLDQLKAENLRLKAQLAELQQQLPEEEEVSNLLKQISDLGVESGLEILLWRPGRKKPDPNGLYVEIPVEIHAVGKYHNLGVFFSHISQIKRLVNLANIRLSYHKPANNIKAYFNAITFAAVAEQDIGQK